MAATNGNSGNTGRKNYYSISYGKLSTKVKQIPDNHTEILEADLKSKIEKVEQVDLRNKYMDKGTGEYPYVVYYDSITGVITSQEKVENDNGIYFHVTLQDTDGDTSILQMKFYSKYAENLMNRLIDVPEGSEVTFFPYAIANEAEIDGKKQKFYTQGVSLKVNGQKIEPHYKHDDKELPATEQVKVQGKSTTSRDKRLDFLYEKFLASFKPTETAPRTETVNQVKEAAAQVDNSKSFIAPKPDESQLPF